MAGITIDYSGTRRYHTDSGILHREDGPAEIWKSGQMRWWYNGKAIIFIGCDGSRTTKLGKYRWETVHPNGSRKTKSEFGIEWPEL